MRMQTFPFLFSGQVNQKPPWQATEDGIVQIERSVCGTDDDYIVVFGRLQPIHFLHEFGYGTPVRMITATAFSGTE